jgi:hypothetical protein
LERIFAKDFERGKVSIGIIYFRIELYKKAKEP